MSYDLEILFGPGFVLVAFVIGNHYEVVLVSILFKEIEGLWSCQGVRLWVELEVEIVKWIPKRIENLKDKRSHALTRGLRGGNGELNWIQRTRKVELVEIFHFHDGESGTDARCLS